MLLALLAIFLFPRQKISYLLRSGNDNPDIGLSRAYIKSLLRIEKKPELMLLLIENDMKTGNYEEALSLIKELEKLENIPRKEILYMKLKIYETQYFSKNSRKSELKEKIRQILKSLALMEFSESKLEELYKKAMNFGFYKTALLISKKAAGKDEDKWLEKAYKTAMLTRNYDEAFNFLDKLIEKSKGEMKVKYIKEAFNLAISTGDYDRGYNYAYKLLSLKALSPKETKKVIDMALFERDYNTAVMFSYEMFNKTHDKYYFKKTVQLALWAGKYELAKHLLDRYSADFITDPEMAVFILKTAMALNDKGLSVKLAQKVVNVYGEAK